MIARIIDFSARNRFLVFLLVFALTGWGVWALRNTPLDAIPDLSDTQVIVFTEWEGRSPDLIEDQVTYPITSTLLAAPKVKVVRGFSFLGASFVYAIFQEGTDIYWARSRVLEYLQAVKDKLPAGVNPVLGPDATSVGWGFSYALVDETGQHNLAELRSMQDWNIKLALESVPGVSQVASLGGFVRQYQVSIDPNRLQAYNLPITMVMDAIRASLGQREFQVVFKAEERLDYEPHDGNYIFRTHEITAITAILGEISERGWALVDLSVHESALEEIYVKLMTNP